MPGKTIYEKKEDDRRKMMREENNARSIDRCSKDRRINKCQGRLFMRRRKMTDGI